MVINEIEYRQKTNDKIERLYQMAESKLKEAETYQDIEVAKRMLIAGLDIAVAATHNAIQRNKKENELY